jgi:phage-related protein
VIERPKGVVFRGSALDDLRAFPRDARRAAGHQIDRVQSGLDPDDWKPMPTIGSGVREIRIREPDGAFRVIYVAKFPGAVVVLHCFRKTTQKTALADIATAKRRYADFVKELQR